MKIYSYQGQKEPMRRQDKGSATEKAAFTIGFSRKDTDRGRYNGTRQHKQDRDRNAVYCGLRTENFRESAECNG